MQSENKINGLYFYYYSVYRCVDGIWKRAIVDEHDHEHAAETESQASVSFYSLYILKLITLPI